MLTYQFQPSFKLVLVIKKKKKNQKQKQTSDWLELSHLQYDWLFHKVLKFSHLIGCFIKQAQGAKISKTIKRFWLFPIKRRKQYTAFQFLKATHDEAKINYISKKTLDMKHKHDIFNQKWVLSVCSWQKLIEKAVLLIV